MSKFSKPHSSVSHYSTLPLLLLLVGVYPEIVFAAPLGESQTVCTNQKISIEWQGPDGRGDLISINDPADQIGAEGHASTLAANGNPAVLKAPSVPGNYVKRYVNWDSGEIVESGLLEVVECER